MAATTPGQINYIFLCTLRAALRCEIAGMKMSRRGQSATKIGKANGFTGSKVAMLAQVQEAIENHPDKP